MVIEESERDMEEHRYLLENIREGVAYNQIITDQNGKPVDYIFLEVNGVFEQLTGLKRDEIIGKKVTEVLPGIREEILDWIDIYGKVASTGESVKFGTYSKQLNHWYWVSAYSHKRGYFTTIFSDLTQAKKWEHEVLYRINLENVISQILMKFSNINAYEIDDAINNAIQIVGAFMNIDRCYVFSYSPDGQAVNNTHEWCAPGIEPQIRKLQNISIYNLPWWMKKLNAFESIYIPDVARMPREAHCEQAILQAQSIQSVLVIPMVYGNSLIGFMGFDSVKEKKIWKPENITVLGIAGQIIANAMQWSRMQQALEAREREFRALVENAPDVIARFDRNLRYSYINPAIKHELGKLPQEVVGKSNSVLGLTEETFQAWDQLLQVVFDTGREKTFEFNSLTPEGRKYYHSRLVPEFAEDGSVVSVLSITRNITAHRLTEQKLKEKEELWKFAIEGSGDGAWDWNLLTNQVVFSDRWKEILEFNKEDFCGGFNEWAARIHPDDFDRVSAELCKHLRGNSSTYMSEHRLQCKDGSYKWILDRGKVLERTAAGEPVRMVGTLTDISKRKKSEEEIRHLTSHDQLTGLYNRTFFEEELRRLDMEMQLPLSLIMGDANGLKLINDAFGHQQGDKFLQRIAHIFKEIFRKEDIIARVGGDEFAVILPLVDQEETHQMVERINKRFREEISDPIRPSIALGAATKEKVTQDIEMIYKCAEDKMYSNKLFESKQMRNSTISSLQQNLQKRTDETVEHCRRIREFSMQIGSKLGLSNVEMEELKLLAVFHDIGKVALPNCILNKAGKLTGEEWEKMKQHSERGYRIALTSPQLVNIAEGILSHHERWDGTGYPQGLSGEEIPLTARIIAVVDAYDAMIHGRCYRKAISIDEAVYELKRCSGTQFDANIVQAFVTIVSGNE